MNTLQPCQNEDQNQSQNAISKIYLLCTPRLHSQLIQQSLSTHANCSCDMHAPEKFLCHHDTTTLSSDDLIALDLLSLSLAQQQGLLRRIHQTLNQPRIFLLNANLQLHAHLIRWQGVRGFLQTNADEAQLKHALYSLQQGISWMPRLLLEPVLKQWQNQTQTSTNDECRLTAREQQLLTLLKHAATNREIAEKLNLSQGTIKCHLFNMYRKMGVKNRLQASQWSGNNT